MEGARNDVTFNYSCGRDLPRRESPRGADKRLASKLNSSRVILLAAILTRNEHPAQGAESLHFWALIMLSDRSTLPNVTSNLSVHTLEPELIQLIK
jgi:hypothetical protein